MFETIRISRYNDAVVHPRVKRCIAVALLATLFASPVPAVWAASEMLAEHRKLAQQGDRKAAPFENLEIAKALSAPPNVPQESQDLASSFLDHTLPKLLTDDERLAHQLGFGDSMSNAVTVDRALPIMLIRRDDVLQLALGKAKPLDLVNNINNWTKDQAGRLVPNRIVFSLKTNNSTSEAGPYTWSSVTLEQSREESWHIIQVGAPKLSRAMREQEDPQTNHFLLWISDLNRHYLGQIGAAGADPANPSIILTALFNDRLVAGRRAGDRFDITSKDFFPHVIKLYKELDLPKKLRGQDGQTQTQMPIQAR